MNLGLFEKRSCEIVGIARSTFRYKPKLRNGEIEIRKRLNELADLRKRYGYRPTNKSSKNYTITSSTLRDGVPNQGVCRRSVLCRVVRRKGDEESREVQ